jgi:hypothetical protein
MWTGEQGGGGGVTPAARHSGSGLHPRGGTCAWTSGWRSLICTLHQYFPKGTDLSVHTPERLLEVAAELNARPPRLEDPWPSHNLALCEPQPHSVATTA